MATLDVEDMLAVAVEQARLGESAGGVPIGAALFGPNGGVLGRGHNRRIQDGDPSAHAETAAFRDAGRRPNYRDTTMVTTLSPCWFCSGLVRQFGIGRVIIGETTTFFGGHDWLAQHGVDIVVVNDRACVDMMTRFIGAKPGLWHEDIGQAE